jgi:signal transduction histidine kinase
MVELSFCSGGCAGSPEIINRLGIWQKIELAENFLKSRKIAKRNHLKIIPSPGTNFEAEFSAKRVQLMEPANEKLKDALARIGIGPEMPNCKVCGYNSCGEFAAALIRGEADPAFCFPALAKRMTRMDEKFLRSERLASVGQIAAGLAHEVNNPLGLASGYAQTLFKNEKLSDQAKQILVLIRDEIEHAASIIQNFLNLARERPARFETVNFYDVLAATLRLVAPRLEASGIALILDYIPEALLLECDSYGLQQVFTNIVLNAWQAMPEGGKLFISVRALPDQVIVKFRDVGVGIKSEHIPKLFDPFFTTKPPGMGTGLGLTIAYKIIEQHKGDIQALSEPGKGAEFVITLPRAPAKKQSEGLSG